MAPHISNQSMRDRLDAAQLAAEWANVGVCGGMFRPVNGLASGRYAAIRRQGALLPADSANWQPHRRCCL